MSGFYFNPVLLNYIPSSWKDDGTYNEDTWPEGMVLLTEEEVQTYRNSPPPDGKILGSIDGRPAWVDPPPPSDEALAAEARNERDQLLVNVYDKGINMALRALRIASTPEEKAYAEGKVSELDLYAEALISLPEQAGFPQTIIWPIAPTK